MSLANELLADLMMDDEEEQKPKGAIVAEGVEALKKAFGAGGQIKMERMRGDHIKMESMDLDDDGGLKQELMSDAATAHQEEDHGDEEDEEEEKIDPETEARTAEIAPNLCCLLGSTIASLLVRTAGGLRELANQTAANILVFGKPKKTFSGLSTATTLPHAGYIYHHPIVQQLPPKDKKSAARIVAAKSTLAARVDLSRTYTDGSYGLQLAKEVNAKFEKMLEPPPVKRDKALPKPLDAPSKKRGGKRARAAKERLGMTELRTKSNRMNFGEIQDDIMQENVGFTLGHATSGGGADGRIRAPVVDNKTRVRMSKKMQKEVKRHQGSGLFLPGPVPVAGAAAVAKGSSVIQGKPIGGAVSSISFTPARGIVEIISQQPVQSTQKDAASGTSTYFTK